MTTDPLPSPAATISLRHGGEDRAAPVWRRGSLRPGHSVDGPALIAEANATTVVDPGWRAEVTARDHLLLRRRAAGALAPAHGTGADPVLLEIFNNLFMNIAEQMGAVLANSAHSVNIKERRDFSCALFDSAGHLVANAPHVPVHLGSMSQSVRAVRAAFAGAMRPGDAYVLNAPFAGGTHLPDVTVVTLLFDPEGDQVLFYLGSRGHHADMGGKAPGSMPADSRTLAEEGVVLTPRRILRDGVLDDAGLRAALKAGGARNPDQNLADLQAQLAANTKGAQELTRLCHHHGVATVRAYMGHVQDNAAACVRRVLTTLADGAFAVEMDNGATIRVALRVDREACTAVVDFTGTSAARPDNFNAPPAVTRAAVLYVFRTLVAEPIPLNEGCLRPLTLVIPPGSLLDPGPEAAVVAGNVETSQAVVDALYGALGTMAASQGSMNNVSFGNDRFQYYETLGGGTGAGPGFHGADAVHSHMTNSRLTDPEVLEHRHPVRVTRFHVRAGSGGAGRWHGGEGMVRGLTFLEPVTVSLLTNRRRVAPYGLAGGAAGVCGRNRVVRADGREEAVAGVARLGLEAGDTLVVETPGGGGYGGGSKSS